VHRRAAAETADDMRAAFFDLDRALLRSPVEAAARRFLRSIRRETPLLPLEEFRGRLRRQARALIAAHHWRGHVVVLLTDGTAEWAEMAGEELDADGVLRCLDGAERGQSTKRSERSGTQAFDPVGQVGDGLGWSATSGRAGPDRVLARTHSKRARRSRSTLRVPWRAGVVTRFCSRYNFAAGASFGYGAQDDDWLWLETLGHPAVAHPSGDLRRSARESGWPILNLNGRSQLSTPPALGFGPAPPSAPPCVTLT